MIGPTQAASGTTMQTLIRAAVLIAVAGTLFACKPKAEPASGPEALAEAAPAGEANVAATDNLIEACVINMTEPESVRLTTYWDAESLRKNSDSPSSARSIYWASEEEKQSQTRGGSGPLTIRCKSSDTPAISFTFSAHASTEAEVPLGTGEYEIVDGSQGAAQPGKFVASSVVYDGRRIGSVSGTLNLDRFDMDGVRGLFRVNGKGTDGEDFFFEGTFEIPCRGGAMESACESNRSF